MPETALTHSSALSNSKFTDMWGISPAPSFTVQVLSDSDKVGNEISKVLTSIEFISKVEASTTHFFPFVNNPHLLIFHYDPALTSLERAKEIINNYNNTPLIAIGEPEDESFLELCNIGGIDDVVPSQNLSWIPHSLVCVLRHQKLKREFTEVQNDMLMQEKRIKALYELSHENVHRIQDQLQLAIKVIVELLGMEAGIISQIEEEEDEYTILYCHQSREEYELSKGKKYIFKDTYCSVVYAANDAVAIDDFANSKYSDHPCFRNSTVKSYIGIPIIVDGERFGTLNSFSLNQRSEPFKEFDIKFMRLAGRWVSAMLEKYNIEDALRQSEDRHRFIVENQTELICRFLPDTTLTFVNEAYCRFFQKSREELTGISFLDLIPEVERQSIREQLSELMDKPQTLTYEHEVILPDGSSAWQQWVDHPITSESGEVKEFLSVGRDITRLKQAEDSIIRSMVQGENKERQRISREIHDSLGQTLTATHLTLNSIQKEIDTLSSRKQTLFQTALSLLGQAIRECRDISNNLLPKGIEDFGLLPTFTQLTKKLEQASNIDFELQSNIQGKRFSHDTEINLYRIAQEVLHNAIKYAMATKCTVRLMLVEGTLQMKIKDNGVGFDLEEVQKATKGMGLHNIRNRVVSLGGSIEIITSPGSGTLVSLTVPQTYQ